MYRVLIFSTAFCVNCRSTKPLVKAACEKKGIELIEIDPTVEHEDSVIALWHLKQVPTVIAVRIKENGQNGEEIDRQEGGLTPSAVDEFLLHVERVLEQEEKACQ